MPNLQEQSVLAKEYVPLEDITNGSGALKKKVIVNQPQPLVQVHPQNFHDDEEQDHANGTSEEGTSQEQISQVRRYTRERRPPTRYKDFLQYLLFCDESEPITFEEAW